MVTVSIALYMMETMTTLAFPETPTVDSISDGLYYTLPRVSFAVTNVHTRVAKFDHVVIKLPTERALSFHQNAMYRGHAGPNSIRDPSDLELPARMDEALEEYPELKQPINRFESYDISIDAETIHRYVHYLIMHKHHVVRLKQFGSVNIPDARFVLFRESGAQFSLRHFKKIHYDRIIPGIVQQRAFGHSLWNIYSPWMGVWPKWRPYLPEISKAAAPLFREHLRDFFDWNLRNFLYNTDERSLSYVDSKPSVFAGKIENDNNFRSFQKAFGEIARFGE
ncbi:MAG: hypothetical protein ABSH09_13145 [Bryobacteraceae bacterium]|jgi:hypothetical protein